jgi:hypothetical protein
MDYSATWEKRHGLAGEKGNYTEAFGVPEDKIVFGTNTPLNASGKGNFWQQGGWLSRKMNHIPGMNSLARLHDQYQISFGAGLVRHILNVPAMIPATVVNYGRC